MIARVQVQMRDIMQRIDRITPTIKINCSIERINKYLPLKSINDIQDMETQLEEKDFLEKYVSKKCK